MEIETEVLLKGEARFDMVGTFLGYHLQGTEGKISARLSERLAKYALTRLDAWGLVPLKVSKILVGTTDADDKVADRYYYVYITNHKGAQLQVVGIMLTAHQQVHFDHGIEIGFVQEGGL
jgi:hypothetical protein